MAQLERFWIFGGPEYYPQRGLNDLIFTDSDLQRAVIRLQKHALAVGDAGRNLSWYQILDTQKNTVVRYHGCGANKGVPGLKYRRGDRIAESLTSWNQRRLRREMEVAAHQAAEEEAW